VCEHISMFQLIDLLNDLFFILSDRSDDWVRECWTPQETKEPYSTNGAVKAMPATRALYRVLWHRNKYRCERVIVFER